MIPKNPDSYRGTLGARVGSADGPRYTLADLLAVVAAEREACAEVAERFADKAEDRHDRPAAWVAGGIADAIRARGAK